MLLMNIPAFVSEGYSGLMFFKNCVAFQRKIKNANFPEYTVMIINQSLTSYLNICKLRHSNIRDVGMESRQFTIQVGKANQRSQKNLCFHSWCLCIRFKKSLTYQKNYFITSSDYTGKSEYKTKFKKERGTQKEQVFTYTFHINFCYSQ